MSTKESTGTCFCGNTRKKVISTTGYVGYDCDCYQMKANHADDEKYFDEEKAKKELERSFESQYGTCYCGELKKRTVASDGSKGFACGCPEMSKIRINRMIARFAGITG